MSEDLVFSVQDIKPFKYKMVIPNENTIRIVAGHLAVFFSLDKITLPPPQKIISKLCDSLNLPGNFDNIFFI